MAKKNLSISTIVILTFTFQNIQWKDSGKPNPLNLTAKSAQHPCGTFTLVLTDDQDQSIYEKMFYIDGHVFLHDYWNLVTFQLSNMLPPIFLQGKEMTQKCLLAVLLILSKQESDD